MFSDITSTSTARLIEVREYLEFIKTLPNPQHAPIPSINAMKGLFYVHLYGAYEYTIKATVVRCISIINQKKPKISDCKPLFMSLAVSDELDSLSDVGNSKKWKKRWELFSVIESNVVEISEELMPTDGKNYRYAQLDSIWKSFCIADNVLPRGAIGGRIIEMVEARNKIAHGNESPIEVGRRKTIDDLMDVYNDINEFCTYMIQVFEDYILQEKYLR